jgi:dihydrofolate synthase/folylpolyglutamate synthase
MQPARGPRALKLCTVHSALCTSPPWTPPPGHADPAYRAVLHRLYALGQGRMLPGRERLRRVLARAGNPHLAVPSILVGGTNGKGSCVAALSAALAEAYTVGAFLKPHLVSVRERWRIGDRTVGVEPFTAAATEALDLIGSHHAATGEEISFFEANVLIGALLFRGAGCEWAVWEVGLGGREDACNLVDPRLSILCNVGLDHQHILGDTLAAIARDKAHIARPGCKLLLGGPRPGWEAAYAEYAPVVREVCGELGGDLVELPAVPAAQWAAFTPGSGAVPPDTELLVRAACSELGLAVPARLSMRYPGRMERTTLGGVDLSGIPGAEHLGAVASAPVLLDASHNADSIAWLAGVLRQGSEDAAETPRLRAQGSGEEQGTLEPGFPLLFGCQATRDPREMLTPLAPHIGTLVPLEVPVLHPCPLARIVEAAESLGLTVSLPESVTVGAQVADYAIGHLTELDPPDNRTGWLDCVAHALALATEQRPLVVCGSIYNLGEIVRIFGQQASADAPRDG